MPSPNLQRIVRGEVWFVRFDPSEGDEIQKTRLQTRVGVITAGELAKIAAAIALCVGYPPG